MPASRPLSPNSRYSAVHADPHGPGDDRPTGLGVVKDEGLQGKLADKTVLITGCSPGGLGIEVARGLHSTGAHVFITVRDAQKGQKALQEILSTSTSTQGKVDVLQLDLNSLQSVRECAADFLSKSKTLNVLINNAGVMACPEGKTKEGFETQFGTNHVAHFLLFQLLKQTLLESSTPQFNSRLVSVSSSGHEYSGIQFDDLDLNKGGYDMWKAYGQSKTANIYLANEVDRRFGSQGLHANSVMPGVIFTPLARHLDPAMVKAFETPYYQKLQKNAAQGAATTVWAAIGKECEGKGGKYLEDCSISKPREDGKLSAGYASHAYDEEAAQRLWDLSLKLVGMPDTTI